MTYSQFLRLRISAGELSDVRLLGQLEKTPISQLVREILMPRVRDRLNKRLEQSGSTAVPA